jgi:hypothetical protein
MKGFSRFFGVLSLVLTGCGSDEAPKSTVSMAEGGSSGGGSGGALTLSTGASGAGAGGASAGAGAGGANGGSGSKAVPEPPTVMLHTCPATPDPPCPAKALAGDVTLSTEAELAALQGVTSIEGKLRIRYWQLDSLSCLESVGDDLEVDIGSGGDGDTSLYGLRNVKSIGGSLDISGTFERVYPDCGFARLESLGAKYVTGGAVDANDLGGELDLSSLKAFLHIRLKNNDFTRVLLPDAGTFKIGQLALENNPYLSEVVGFSNATLQVVNNGSYSLRVVSNPQLSECRARQLAKLFTDGGAEPASITVMSNLPCAE